MTDIIQVDQLKKSYGSSEVLKGINLTVQQGEIFGIVGHNGAGKSTLIHVLTGITHKSSGGFRIFDQPESELDAVKKRMGVMPDTSNLYEQMRGIDFLRYMGRLKQKTYSRADYLSLLEQVGLADAEQKRIKSYSFGMRKKISIAQALLGNPELIFLDEPTSGIDPESAIHIRNLVLKLKQQGKTIILTSHNLDEIDRICDRVAMISDGVINKLGTPQELKTGKAESMEMLLRTKPVLQESQVRMLSEKLSLYVRYAGLEKEHVLLKVATEEDIPLLARALIEHDFMLYEVKVRERSLEEVFMEK